MVSFHPMEISGADRDPQKCVCFFFPGRSVVKKVGWLLKNLSDSDILFYPMFYEKKGAF